MHTCPIVGSLLVLRLAITMVILAPAVSAAPADWPQWRGPTRDGAVPAANVPRAWPESFRKAWAIEVGEGYSSPVVVQGRVFVHSRRDPDELVTAIDLSQGKIIWQQKYPAATPKNPYADKMAKGPYATPLVKDGRLFTSGFGGMVVAWEAKSGKKLWRRDF